MFESVQVSHATDISFTFYISMWPICTSSYTNQVNVLRIIFTNTKTSFLQIQICMKCGRA